MNALLLTVTGIAQPQGSARAFTYQRSAEKGGGIGARVDSDNPKLKGWRQTVAWEAKLAMARAKASPTTSAIGVAIRCYLPRPKSRRGPQPHVTRPDADKLARGILDALTGLVYVDDAQVVSLSITKHYAEIGDAPRTEIVVTPCFEPPSLFDGLTVHPALGPMGRTRQ